MEIDVASICDRFAAVYTGAIADVLDEIGVGCWTLPTDLTPLTDEMTMAGIAYPAVGRPDPEGEYDTNVRRVLGMLGEVPPDRVLLVVSNDGTSAHLGELMTTAVQARGARGAVVHSGIRDTAFIRAQGFPVFSRYRTPARWQLNEWVGDGDDRRRRGRSPRRAPWRHGRRRLRAARRGRRGTRAGGAKSRYRERHPDGHPRGAGAPRRVRGARGRSDLLRSR